MGTPKKTKHTKNNNTWGIFWVYVNAAIPTSCHRLILSYSSLTTPTHPTDFELKKHIELWLYFAWLHGPTLSRNKPEFLGLRFHICISWRPWWINLSTKFILHFEDLQSLKKILIPLLHGKSNGQIEVKLLKPCPKTWPAAKPPQGWSVMQWREFWPAAGTGTPADAKRGGGCPADRLPQPATPNRRRSRQMKMRLNGVPEVPHNLPSIPTTIHLFLRVIQHI